VNWNSILQLRAWFPLSELGVLAEPVSTNVFKIGPNAYVRTRSDNMHYEENDPRGPFITRAYWAGTPGAVLREVDGDASIGQERVDADPPLELLMQTDGTYRSLAEKARAVNQRFSERGIYSSTGSFLFKVISSGRLEYCFLDHKENDSERVFLIKIALLS
jgi:hypothetical protein